MNISDSKTLAKEVAAYLVEEKRVNQLESILREVRVYRSEHGILDTQVTSAHSLADSDISDIKSLMIEEFPDTDHVLIDQDIDPKLVGGVIIQTARKQLDMTIRDKIDTFKRLTTRGNI